MSEYLPFHDFCRKYKPLSKARAEALLYLRRIDLTIEHWPTIAAQLKALAVHGYITRASRDLFKFWDENYRKTGRVQFLEHHMPVAQPRPKPVGAVEVRAKVTLSKDPIEVEVDGSFVAVPLGAVAWIKAIGPSSCLLGLMNGEVIEADNTFGELKEQIPHILPYRATMVEAHADR